MLILLSACVKCSLNTLFTQLSRIMASSGEGKNESTSPDPTISLANECNAFQGSYSDTFECHKLFTYLVNNLSVLECAYYKITAFVL